MVINITTKRMIDVVKQILQTQTGDIRKPDLIHATMEYLNISQRYVKEYVELLKETGKITIDDNTQIITLNNENANQIKPEGDCPAGDIEILPE